MPSFTLASLCPLLGVMAAERAKGDPHLYDELRQEGLVTAWRVMRERPDSTRPYVTVSARRAMDALLRGRPAFGAPTHRGRREPLDTATPYALTVEDEDDHAGALADATAAQALARAELVDLRAEVAREVDRLGRDSEIVRLRFWDGLEWSEIATQTGLPRATVSRRWQGHARVTLAERLAHLREVAA
jgi:DNA-directed RNA polymerase specialized sigma24 family protein